MRDACRVDSMLWFSTTLLPHLGPQPAVMSSPGILLEMQAPPWTRRIRISRLIKAPGDLYAH